MYLKECHHVYVPVLAKAPGATPTNKLGIV
jgi:hypothetical protein